MFRFKKLITENGQDILCVVRVFDSQSKKHLVKSPMSTTNLEASLIKMTPNPYLLFNYIYVIKAFTKRLDSDSYSKIINNK